MLEVNIGVNPFQDKFSFLYVLQREPHLLSEDEAFVQAAAEREVVTGLTTHSAGVH